MVGSEIVPLPDGRGIAPNHSPRFYADDAALVDCLRIHVRVLAEHLHAQEG